MRRRWTRPAAACLVCATVIAVVITLLLAAGCGGDTTTTAAPGTTGTTAPSTSAGTQPPGNSVTTGTTQPTETTQPTGTTQPEPGQVTFTTEELAAFDGKDGRPAYVAVDGVVYDVSASRSWPEGTHTRCNLGAMAGKDLSAEIKRAPSSMRSLLAAMPVVGTLQP